MQDFWHRFSLIVSNGKFGGNAFSGILAVSNSAMSEMLIDSSMTLLNLQYQCLLIV